jgi:predicted enzyme related to lactoylglutathione lyase
VTSDVLNITFDCADPYRLGRWWAQVVGRPMSDDDFPGDPEASIALANGTYLFFCAVPEPKTVKNRVHVCLRPEEQRDGEVDRLLGIGAAMVDDRRSPDGSGWAVLTDPEGNEFCVLRSASEHASAPDG